MLHHFRHGVFGADLIPGVFDITAAPYHKCRPDNSHICLAVHLFFSPRSIGICNRVIGIGEQWKSQSIFIVKPLLLFWRIGADTDNGDTFLRQLVECVPHTLGLGCSPGRIGLGVEEYKEWLAGEIRQTNCLFILIRCREVGGPVAVAEMRHQLPPLEGYRLREPLALPLGTYRALAAIGLI